MRSFTISEAAEATGLTQRALRARIEQGHVRAVLREGVPPRIPESELRRAGLLPDRSEAEPPSGDSPVDGGSEILQELVAVIERQAEELAALRARRSS